MGGGISPRLFQTLWLALALPLSYQHVSIVTLMDLLYTQTSVTESTILERKKEKKGETCIL